MNEIERLEERERRVTNGQTRRMYHEERMRTLIGDIPFHEDEEVLYEYCKNGGVTLDMFEELEHELRQRLYRLDCYKWIGGDYVAPKDKWVGGI